MSADMVFTPADILLYNGKNPSDFAVVACDQYTSEPEYWDRVEQQTAGKPSAAHLVFPEAYLKSWDFDGTIRGINASMKEYLEQGLFSEYPDALIYVRRTQRDGKVRCGLVGRVDLEEYDYSAGASSRIRATEGTVLERIPPRVRIRKDAPLELPHVMLLIDDRKKEIIEGLAARKDSFEKVYDFPLMENSGRLEGWLLPQEEKERISAGLALLGETAHFEATYGVSQKPVLQYAVGDGNHSLATARKCYLELCEQLGVESARQHPARWALVELVNLHDNSLVFEAIHRHVAAVQAADVMEKLALRYRLSDTPAEGAQKLAVVLPDGEKTVYITNPEKNLAVGSLQAFLDDYQKEYGGETDYIHGADVVRELVKTQGGIGFLLDPMDKNDLFCTVILDGALPRKTFSMGEACDKRFYFEARRIQPE